MNYKEEYIIKVTKIKADAEEMYKRFLDENAHEYILSMVQSLIEDCAESIEKMKKSMTD